MRLARLGDASPTAAADLIAATLNNDARKPNPTHKVNDDLVEMFDEERLTLSTFDDKLSTKLR